MFNNIFNLWLSWSRKNNLFQEIGKDTGAIHLNPDDVCMQRYSPEEYENNWEHCFAQTLNFLWQETSTYIKQNKDVIFDVGFWSKSSRDEAVNKVKEMGGKPIIHYVYAPDSILKQRLKTRKGIIAERNLLNFDITKQVFEEPSIDENFVTIKNY